MWDRKSHDDYEPQCLPPSDFSAGGAGLSCAFFIFTT